MWPHNLERTIDALRRLSDGTSDDLGNWMPANGSIVRCARYYWSIIHNVSSSHCQTPGIKLIEDMLVDSSNALNRLDTACAANKNHRQHSTRDPI